MKPPTSVTFRVKVRKQGNNLWIGKECRERNELKDVIRGRHIPQSDYEVTWQIDPEGKYLIDNGFIDNRAFCILPGHWGISRLRRTVRVL